MTALNFNCLKRTQMHQNASLILYDHVLSDALSRVNIPVSLLREDTIDPNDATSTLAIDDYYNKIVKYIEKATQLCIPHTLHGSDYNDCFVAGWNDVVKDKHCAARAAYLDWVTAGNPIGKVLCLPLWPEPVLPLNMH